MTPSPEALALTDRIISRWNSVTPESVRVAIAECVEEVLGREAELKRQNKLLRKACDLAEIHLDHSRPCREDRGDPCYCHCREFRKFVEAAEPKKVDKKSKAALAATEQKS